MDDGKNILFDPDSIPRSGASVGIDFRRFPKTVSHHVVTGHEGQPGYLRVVVRGADTPECAGRHLDVPDAFIDKIQYGFFPFALRYAVFCFCDLLFTPARF